MAKSLSLPHFIWKIENFSDVQKKLSPAFGSYGLKWQLRFCRFNDDDEWISLNIVCLSTVEALSTFEFTAIINFVYRDSNFSLLKRKKYCFKDKEFCVWRNKLKDFKRSYEYYLDITFSIMIVPNDLNKVFEHQKNVAEDDHESTCVKSLTADFGKLFNNEELSDFVLTCDGKKFCVHKIVLSARSDFFAGMFRNNMKETNEGIGKIEEIESDVLELVLRYLYTGKIPGISKDTIRKVYSAADRFGVESLKLKCYYLFIDTFISDSKTNPYKAVKEGMAKSNDQTELDRAKENELLKELFSSTEWRSYSEEFPHKAQEMCRPHLLKN